MKALKRPALLAIKLFFNVSVTLAQHAEKAELIVHYKFSHVRDTNNRSHPYTENMALFVGKSASVYRSYEFILEDARYKKEFEAQMAKSPNGYVTVNHNYTGSPAEYFMFPNEQKFFIKDALLSNRYLIEEAMPVIKWKISNETATFGDLHCQKAVGDFKGRVYVVWFCPDLPVRTGPWKLSGLPGVIVDARDSKNEVVFKFDGVEKAQEFAPRGIVASNGKKPLPPLGGDDSNNDPNLIALPANAIKATQKQFDKLSMAMHKDPNVFAQSATAGNINGGPKMDAKPVKGGGTVINNPLELPDKK